MKQCVRFIRGLDNAGIFLALLSVWAFWGCASKPSLQASLPEEFRRRFGSCGQTSTGGRVHIDNDKDFAFNSEIEWISQPMLIGRFLSPLGHTLLGFKLASRRFNFTGKLASKVPEIEVDPSGFLKIDDQWIGIKLSEMLCILESKWPMEWKRRLLAIGAAQEGYWGAIADEGREILFRTNRQSREQCVEVRWFAWWIFFPQEFTACHIWNSKNVRFQYFGTKILWYPEGAD